MEPIVERVPHNGMLIISDIVQGQYFKKRYQGYQKREAIRDFKRFVKEQLKRKD